MKAWHIENLNRIKLVESVLPKREGEIKLKMSKVAISSTDFAYFAAGEENEHGKSVAVPGHSAVAYVSSEDSAAGLKLGARVVVSPFVRYEEHGVAKVKVLGVDTDGLLGDFASVPEENVYALPDGVPDDEAIFAEYIALGNNVLNSMEADKGDFVVIVGASTLGLVLSQLALYYQMIPILVDLDAEKLALAASWGVYYLLNPTYDNLERRRAAGWRRRRCMSATACLSTAPSVWSRTRAKWWSRATRCARVTMRMSRISSPSSCAS